MTWENKRIHTPSLTSWGVLFSIGSSNRGTTLHGGDGGAKLKLYFLLLKSVKRKKPSFGRIVSTRFVGDCTFFIFFALKCIWVIWACSRITGDYGGKIDPVLESNKSQLIWAIESEAMRVRGIIFFSKIQLVGQKYRDKTTFASKTRFSRHFFRFQSRRFSLLMGYNL